MSSRLTRVGQGVKANWAQNWTAGSGQSQAEARRATASAVAGSLRKGASALLPFAVACPIRDFRLGHPYIWPGMDWANDEMGGTMLGCSSEWADVRFSRM